MSKFRARAVIVVEYDIDPDAYPVLGLPMLVNRWLSECVADAADKQIEALAAAGFPQAEMIAFRLLSDD